MNDIERRRRKGEKMDIFDKLNEVMDDLGIAKDDGRRETVNIVESATKAAKFLAVISDPDERERAIKDALTQTYIAGMQASK